MALPTAAFLSQPSQLAQLLEEINFQRTKEMRQLMKDDSGFVVLQGTTYWTDLFVRHFLFQAEPAHNIDSDDLLFFVRKKHVRGTSRHMPKFETEVDVYRKDSRKLPIGDPDVDWEETVYLNMVIHQFNYTLTLAICTRTSPKELQVLRRHSQRVYASPSRRKMDTKGENEEMTYPHICFMVDNFDEVFSDILVRDGEMVCVELVASDKDGSVQGVIFLGSIRYDALKKVYDARQSSLSSKVAQRMTFGLFSSGAGVQTRCEFVRMKGPQGKGHAEMAVTKPKGSGVETPTSEPGFCATEMWDDWEEDPDEYFTRHQRRLSDPSANLNNFTRYGWKYAKEQSSGSKARSENEGLDSLANEVSEIEAGDLRDDRGPASSASQVNKNSNDDNISVTAVNKVNKLTEEKNISSLDSTSTYQMTNINDNSINKNSISTLNNVKISVENSSHITESRKLDRIVTSTDDFDVTLSRNEQIENDIDEPNETSDLLKDEHFESKMKTKSKDTNNDVKIKSPPSSSSGLDCCTGCFTPSKCKKRWSDTDSAQMSEIYSRSIMFEDEADGGIANATPACLEKFSVKKNRFQTQIIVKNKIKENPSVSGKTKTLINNDGKQQKKSTIKTPSIPRSKSLATASGGYNPHSTPSSSSTKRENSVSRKSIFHSSLKKDTKTEKSNSSRTTISLSSIRKKTGTSLSSSSSEKCTQHLSTDKKNGPNSQRLKTTIIRSNKGNIKTSTKTVPNSNKFEEYEIGDDVTSLNEEQIVSSNEKETEKLKICVLSDSDPERIRVHGKEELPVVTTKSGTGKIRPVSISAIPYNLQNTTFQSDKKSKSTNKLLISSKSVDDSQQTMTTIVTSNKSRNKSGNIEKIVPTETKSHPLQLTETCTQQNDSYHKENDSKNSTINANEILSTSQNAQKVIENANILLHEEFSSNIKNEPNQQNSKIDVSDDYNGNNRLTNSIKNGNNSDSNNIITDNSKNLKEGNVNNNAEILSCSNIINSTTHKDNLTSNNAGNNNLHRTRSLPGIKTTYSRYQRSLSTSERYQNLHEKLLKIVPKHITPDGTSIYYWCDLFNSNTTKIKTSKELDDGAYNPLWASKGFTQQFHFWKESRRQQSTPLNAFLTYVTLPWWSIAKDLLDHRETPILTF